MKALITVLLLTLSIHAYAQEEEIDSTECTKGKLFHGFMITKHKNNIYEVVVMRYGVRGTYCNNDSTMSSMNTCSNAIMGWKMEEHALLVTNKTVFKSRGRFSMCVADYVHHSKITNSDGFPETIAVYFEAGARQKAQPAKRVKRGKK